jgi:hypothetical protein
VLGCLKPEGNRVADIQITNTSSLSLYRFRLSDDVADRIGEAVDSPGNRHGTGVSCWHLLILRSSADWSESEHKLGCTGHSCIPVTSKYFRQLHGIAKSVRIIGVAIAQFLRERHERQQSVGISRRSKPKTQSSSRQDMNVNATFGKRLSLRQSNNYTFHGLCEGRQDTNSP